tara:strand:+ start:109 stop:504 length:396 start_codon:yes stop_codon:yes gene_type:complete
MPRYSDIDLDFDSNSFTNDLVLKTDQYAIKQSVLNMLLSKKGDKPFTRAYGVGFRDMLFNQYTLGSPMIIESNIQMQFEKWEPRATLIGVVIDENNIDSNLIGITVNYQINTIGSGNPITDSITLEIEKVR